MAEPRSRPASGDTEPSNAGLFERACAVLPGGVNSPVRAFGAVGGTPYFVASAHGAHVWDVEGNRYIDYVQSYGPTILGHAPPSVVEAVCAAAAAGTSFGAPTEAEVRLAEEMRARVPGLETLRLTSSGTEAAMSAVRLARGATGRNKIIKFAGCYHGHADSLLAAGGSGVANQGLSGCDGVTPGAVADTVVAPYNVVPKVDEDTAAVLVEPVAANMGLVAPQDGFLAGLRAACDGAGALLVFDEVITGFRLGRGGAAEFYGVRPDLWCFGKVIGGGLPVGAFGGSRELMAHLAPLGGVYQAGTLSGNPLATAAGLATLEALDAAAYERLEAVAARLASGLEEAFGAAGTAAVVPRVGSLLGLFFGAETPRDFDGAAASVARGLYAPFFGAMLRRGVALAPGPYEAIFVSLAHSDADIDATVAAAAEAAAELP
ncbi:MAG: glutamate-1-semialdehyde-2,1-aminomutase [Acidimicrobiia bacterium]|nr:glutamate-1-semialdehyde 2,1-aminomutase [bacterium]MXZ29583.1 glutamate-1-semialdehyde-2,1-aminomutase [Acidimicrobiia bacterium]MYE67131.1 glutamate-1-semialdehyde-2,1-aminomutase [Acidimicrobiia bacterium]MYJ14051.1 glutamate-1-semialdehyde-2,1-aminomutase [Acidimicrobiia bacterium]